MAAAQGLKQLQWDDEAVAALQPSIDASPWGPLKGVMVLEGAHLWEFNAGPVHALLAVRGNEFPHGRLLECLGLRSTGERLQPAHLNAIVDQLAAAYGGLDVVALCTRYPHLVRTCERGGWTNTGAIVVKRLRLQ